MARTISIISDGITYDLGDGTLTYDVFLDGVGIPPVERRLVNGPRQDGSDDHGYRLHPREMSLILYYSVASESAADTRRDALYSVFRPSPNAMTLIYGRANGTQRRIDCYLNGAIEMAESDRTGYDQRFVVPLVAPNPIWYEPTAIDWFPTITSTGFVNSFSYAGSWHDYPVITLTGEIVNPSLMTTITGRSYYITLNTTVPAGQSWTIDCRPGKKSVKNGSGVSQYQYLQPDTFGIAEWRLAYNNQSVRLYYTSKGAGAQLKLTYYNRYLGA